MLTNAEKILQTCHDLGVDPKIRQRSLEVLAATEETLAGEWINED
jgi:hypothetical protein